MSNRNTLSSSPSVHNWPATCFIPISTRFANIDLERPLSLNLNSNESESLIVAPLLARAESPKSKSLAPVVDSETFHADHREFL